MAFTCNICHGLKWHGPEGIEIVQRDRQYSDCDPPTPIDFGLVSVPRRAGQTTSVIHRTYVMSL